MPIPLSGSASQAGDGQAGLSAGHTVGMLSPVYEAHEEGAVGTATVEKDEEEASVLFFSSWLD